MKRSVLITLIFCVLPQLSFAAPWKQSAESVLKKEINSTGISTKYFGIWLKRDKGVVAINADKKFVPASLSKIPTALSFLDRYPMSHRFYTWFYKTGPVVDGVLKGDLYLKGGGDPTFVTESMWLMINRLKRDDIQKIEGNIYLDDTYFDKDHYSNGRQTRRVDRAYDAPVGALSFNWNSLSIYVRPGSKAGAKARVYIDPPIPYVKVDNKATTSSASKKTSLKVSRISETNGEKIIVKGSISLSKDEKAFYKSVTRPTRWTAQHLLYFLTKAGIDHKGKYDLRPVPPAADMLVEWESWEMPRMVAAMSKFSNNFVAEMLTKHIGKNGKTPGTIDDGVNKIVHYLNDHGWKPGEFSFRNPSGFTRKNLMRPDLLGNLLDKSQEQFNLAPEFMSSLPISGMDGTLKDRMKRAMKGKVRAKTGYLAGVVGLAGYLQPRSGGSPITFVFFYNGPAKEDWEVRALFDRLLWRLYQTS